jgi:hypothetical protein
MSYGFYRNSGIVCIRNYAEALKQWESTTPIRRRKNADGTPKDVRPLGHRRNTWYLIVKNSNDDIECRMYDEPIVTFKANGEVVLSNYSYNTTSTASFMREVMRHQISNALIFDYSLVVRIGGVEQRINCGNSITVKRGDNGNYHFVDMKPEVTHTINRKGANIVRARYADFMQYLTNMAKLRGEEYFTREELSRGLNALKDIDLGRLRYVSADNEVTVSAIGQFNKFISDTSEDRFEGYYTAMLMLIYSYGRYSWKASAHILDISYVLYGLDKVILGLNRDECFVATQTPDGLARRDTYKDYFKGVWQKYHVSRD